MFAALDMSAVRLFELASLKSGRCSLMLTGVVRAISSLARGGCLNGLSPEHVQTARVSKFHGCDLFTFRHGKIALKNSYRKNRPPVGNPSG